MTPSLQLRSFRAALVVLLVALVAVMVPVAPPADAQSTGWDVERFEADTGTGISTVVARRMWPDSDTVVMARADQFADALAAAPVAALLDAPLLLTDQYTMPRHVWEQIEHYSPSRVVVMGGSAAVGDTVVDELRGWGVTQIDRIQGPNRFATAAAALDFVRANGGNADPFVVRGEGAGHIGGWEDAVAVSQHAALLGAPILLSRQGDLPAETDAALAADAPDTITIVGGEAAVSRAVSDQLWARGDVSRLDGVSRYHTSLSVADATEAAGADLSTVWLVNGANWQDALVAGATAGTLGGVLLYVNPHVWSTSVGRDWILARTGHLDQVNIVGERGQLPTEVDFELTDLATPHAPWSPPAGVRITPGANAQAIVDANPPGTTYVFTAGEHRLTQVEPKDGDRFTGETGAVLLGAIDIDTSQAYQDGDGRWVVPGVTFEPPPPAAIAEAEEGREGELIQTDLFAGRTRLAHTGQRGSLTLPDQWHLDTANDVIVLGQDPATLGQLQLSVAPWAFWSTARDVEIDHLEIRRYATAAKVGAIDAHNGWAWNIHHVTVMESKSAGVRTGAGTRVADSRLAHNGQIGITGGDHLPDGSQAPVVLEGNEFAFNGEVGYRWDWEAGGAKMTNTVNSVFLQNWAHHNRGPGLWCDLDCNNPHWVSNLTEHNEFAGILVEETVTALVDSNVSRANGAFAFGDLGGGIWVSNSPDTEVRSNVLESNRFPIMANHNGIPSGEFGVLEIADLYVHSNDIRIDAYLPGLRVTTNEPERYERDDLVWESNVYRLREDRAEHFWWGRKVTVPEWTGQLRFDTDGRFLPVDATAMAPPAPFRTRPYGSG